METSTNFKLGTPVKHRWFSWIGQGHGYFVKVNETGKAVVTNYDPTIHNYPMCQSGYRQQMWNLSNVQEDN